MWEAFFDEMAKIAASKAEMLDKTLEFILKHKAPLGAAVAGGVGTMAASKALKRYELGSQLEQQQGY